MKGNPDKHLIPSLDEYLDIVKQYEKVAFIELKENFKLDQIKLIMDKVKSKLELSKVAIISFHLDALKLLREYDENIEIMALYNSFNEINIEEVKQYNFGVDVEFNGVTDSQIDELMLMNIPLNLWSIDNKEIAHKYGRKGVDYITTNSIESFKD